MDPKVCLLCEQILSVDNTHTIGIRAIETVVASSLRRKDKKHLMLQILSSLDIHKYCYTKYIPEAAIAAAEKASKKRVPCQGENHWKVVLLIFPLYVFSAVILRLRELRKL